MERAFHARPSGRHDADRLKAGVKRQPLLGLCSAAEVPACHKKHTLLDVRTVGEFMP